MSVSHSLDYTNSPVSSTIKGPRFSDTRRFARDGTTGIANFLNGRDGEGRELSPRHRAVDTNTHTDFQERTCGDASPSFAQEITKSFMGKGALEGMHLERSCTPLSFMKGDSRFLNLQSPYYPEQLGPGSYDVCGALGQPAPLGLLPPDSPLCSWEPAKDPSRPSSPFSSPPRSPVFRPTEFGYLTPYLSCNFKGLSEKAPKLYKSDFIRADVSDYRYSTRHSEARKEFPPNIEDSPEVDSAGRLVCVASKLQALKPAAAPFMSKLPRFTYRHDEQPNDNKRLPERHRSAQPYMGPKRSTSPAKRGSSPTKRSSSPTKHYNTFFTSRPRTPAFHVMCCLMSARGPLGVKQE